MPEILEEKDIERRVEEYKWEIASKEEERDKLLMLLRDYVAVYAGAEVAGLCEAALAEALSNAMYHGNLGVKNTRDTEEKKAKENDPVASQKKIRVKYVRSGDCLTFLVMDSGNGFDTEEVLQKMYKEDPKRCSGLKIISKTMNEFYFFGGGNSIFMIKYLDKL